MAIDTLAYAKALEAAGEARGIAEAHAEARTHHILPDLVTKPDLTQAVERLEHRMDLAISQQTARLFGMMLGVVGLMDAILFALLRWVH
jgi:hypothetical protein